MSLKNCIAVVSGAASGLGRATAERLVKQGARVVCMDLNVAALEEVVKSLGPSARVSVRVKAGACGWDLWLLTQITGGY